MSTKIHNKSSKPDNIIARDNEIIKECEAIESSLPKFMREYFIFLRGSVAVTTRRAYLQDILFFCNYLVEADLYTNAEKASNITIDEFKEITSRDVNLFIGDYCNRYYKNINDDRVIFENNSRSLSRKKSSLSTLFKFLFRNEQLPSDITGGFNPIKLQKTQPDAIKRLEIDEVAIMLDTVQNGTGLTDKEKDYWLKTKLRDKAILVLFVTYGLRLSELRELNISSFNFSRGVFVIYRKRGKEVQMPINDACEKVVLDYIENERAKNEELDSKNEDALFLSLQKKRMTTRSIRDLVKKYTSIAMGTSRNHGYSPHKLRATAATSMIETGFSIYDVQNLLDHDNVTTTQLYSAHRKNSKREIVKNFDWLDEDSVLGVKRND
ncbi:tyrosine-type recombinase/integrase [Peptostreptococcus sp. D1]|uniref:tyrosine-type recombinase/integrase n=1 Tax=Peptostreptococcus sp. D1 TaxID=72304 RepID=UPI0008E30C29|nr:tyrosine-type recombinase/integrase [Peptostreptococcus sp. D1]SFE42781.1 Site-specific recombinase XerD [Peptostreptococcus sp. D1]